MSFFLEGVSDAPGYDKLFAMRHNFTLTKSGNPSGISFTGARWASIAPSPPSVPLCSYRAV